MEELTFARARISRPVNAIGTAQTDVSLEVWTEGLSTRLILLEWVKELRNQLRRYP